MPALSEERARSLFGDPSEVAGRLHNFRQSASVLSSSHSHLIDEYPQEWIAVHDGVVRAHSKDFRALLSQIDEAGISRREVIVRFVERNHRALIV